MECVRLESLEPRGWPSPAVTVGNFDGVHRGHQALVAAAVRAARALGGTSVALSFDPHPSRVLSPDRAPASLMTIAQKAEMLAALGVERFAVLPFTVELSVQPPEEFARGVLVQALGARRVVVGSNFRFGCGRKGDSHWLRELGKTLHFETEEVPPVLHEGSPISSTRIREALARGDVEAARELLGRRFFVDGRVVHGEGRGKSLGFPTANLAVENEMMPRGGVYAAWCRVDRGARTAAVVNVGRRPTFGPGDTQVEAHLLEGPADLYGHRLRVEFEQRLRGERAFAGPSELTDQIRRDVGDARRLLGDSARED